MKDWKALEEHLRSWSPRAPSPKLKERIFGTPAATVALEEPPIRPAAWHWLAPAMAVFVFSLFLNGRGVEHLAPTPGVLAQFALAEPDHASYYALAHHCENNAVQVMTIDWTNSGHSLTTAVPVAPTNSLMQ